MELSIAIELAAELAYEEDADQVVGRIQGEWLIAHNEDAGRINEMTEPTFTVHSDGVDRGHIERGEITEDWNLPS